MPSSPVVIHFYVNQQINGGGLNQNNGYSCKKYGCGRVRLLQPRLESEVALTAKLDARQESTLCHPTLVK
jgi:hypothetical protein